MANRKKGSPRGKAQSTPVDLPTAKTTSSNPMSTRLAEPTYRPLRVYAFDPSRGRLLGNEMQINVRYRQLAPGPMDKSGAYDQIAIVVLRCHTGQILPARQSG